MNQTYNLEADFVGAHVEDDGSTTILQFQSTDFHGNNTFTMVIFWLSNCQIKAYFSRKNITKFGLISAGLLMDSKALMKLRIISRIHESVGFRLNIETFIYKTKSSPEIPFTFFLGSPQRFKLLRSRISPRGSTGKNKVSQRICR